MITTKELIFEIARKAVEAFPKMVKVENKALQSLTPQTIRLHLKDFNLQHDETLGLKNSGGDLYIRKNRMQYTIKQIRDGFERLLMGGDPLSFLAETVNVPTLRVEVCKFNKERRCSLVVKTKGAGTEKTVNVILKATPKMPSGGIFQPGTPFPERIEKLCRQLYSTKDNLPAVRVDFVDPQLGMFVETLNKLSLAAVEQGWQGMAYELKKDSNGFISGAVVRLSTAASTEVVEITTAGGNPSGQFDWPIDEEETPIEEIV